MNGCSVVSDSASLWTVAHQAPLSMEFFRQEHWSVLPFPPPGDLPNPGAEPGSLVSPAFAGDVFTPVPPAIIEPSADLKRETDSKIVLSSMLQPSVEAASRVCGVW